MTLVMTADWQRLATGRPEDRACQAALRLSVGERCLTEVLEVGEDGYERLRREGYLSAYRLAEWLAWNWWRLRWESKPTHDGTSWALAHVMRSIGGGYVWPNITIFSDGERVVLAAKPTPPSQQAPTRHFTDATTVIRAAEFEVAVDRFLIAVQDRLRSQNVAATNVDLLWSDVLSERSDPELAERRRLEAMLGFDPDQAATEVIERLVADGNELGHQAMAQLAAEGMTEAGIMTADRLRDLADTIGFAAQPAAVARLSTKEAQLAPIGEVSAWRRGSLAARALRSQERLGEAPISNPRLAELAGVDEQIIAPPENKEAGADMSFALDLTAHEGRVVLRSKFSANRRFGLARLLGDRLIGATGERLLPATRANTYRQKQQRAFAAELLCPFEALEDFLRGDETEEALEGARRHFNVSLRTVETVMVSNGRLDRDVLAGDDPEAGTTWRLAA